MLTTSSDHAALETGPRLGGLRACAGGMGGGPSEGALTLTFPIIKEALPEGGKLRFLNTKIVFLKYVQNNDKI